MTEQIQIRYSVPTDGNATPVLSVTPGEWGDLRTYELLIPAGTAVSIVDAVVDPSAFIGLSRPMELTMWLLQNFNSLEYLWVGGEEVGDNFGIILPAAVDSTHPGTLALKTDITKTYIYNPSSGDVGLLVTFIGRYLRG